MNYAKNLPRDTGNQAMQEFPAPFVSVSRLNKSNATVSSVINLHHATTTIEVGAFGGAGAVIRWVPVTETAAVAPRASVTNATYDHWIPPSTYRRFVVPRETAGGPTGHAGSVNGLYNRVAFISANDTASSVLLSEF